MNRIEIKPELHFWLSGREYVIKQRLAQGELQISEVITGVTSIVKETAIIQLLFRGELKFEQPNHTVTELKKRDYLYGDFSSYPESLREEAKKRYRYVNRVLELNLPQRTASTLIPIIQQVAQEINDPKPPNWITLYRWIKSYENSNYDIRTLVPKHQKKGDYRPKLHREVIQIINQAIQSIYLTPEKPDIADVYQEVLRLINQENQARIVIGMEPLKTPHRSTIYRSITKLEPSVVASCRYGKRIASQMYDPVQRSPQVSRPLERVEIDHTKLPLFVVDAENRLPIGTPWLTSAIDKYSGVTLGYYLSFEPPSYLSVMQCLLHAITPKNYLHSQYTNVENSWEVYGLPEVIVVDNGKEFYSTHLEDACLQLGITIQYCPPKMPWYKSAIERYFGALNSQLLSEVPGKNFSNFLSCYDYDPTKNAVVSFAALQEMLHIFIVDIHNQSDHPELKSPRSQVWVKGITAFPPALPPSQVELKALIGQITTRKITRRGIEFEGLLYNSTELAKCRSRALKGTKTTVKYDPTDLSKIYVFDDSNYQFIEVPALNQDYTKGLSLWQHRVVKQLAAQEANQVDIVALALAKEKIQKIVEREWNLSKKGKTRTAMARWLGIGRDGINTSSVSQREDQPIPVNETAFQDNTSTNQASGITGISDLENAFNSIPKEVEIEKIAPDTFSEAGVQPSQKVKQKKRKQEIETNNQDWQPNLEGWSVTIGLPKGGET